MAAPYNHRAIERNGVTNWEETPVNVNDGKKPKYYCLDMFPYPSGSGLHVGHWRGYVISDVWSRYQDAPGLLPDPSDGMGCYLVSQQRTMPLRWGSSQYYANIKNIKRQINEIAAIYDWDMEVNTTDPNSTSGHSGFFVKMFKAGLAYEKEMPINWCPYL